MYNQKYLKYKEKYLNLKNQKGKGKNNNLFCPICIHDFPYPPAGIDNLHFMHLNNDNYRESTCCQNVFHKECIINWKIKRNTCPICRADPFIFLNDINHDEYVSPLIKSEYQNVVVNKFKNSSKAGKEKRINNIVENVKEKFRRPLDKKIEDYSINLIIEWQKHAHFELNNKEIEHTYQLQIKGFSFDSLQVICYHETREAIWDFDFDNLDEFGNYGDAIARFENNDETIIYKNSDPRHNLNDLKNELNVMNIEYAEDEKAVKFKNQLSLLIDNPDNWKDIMWNEFKDDNI